MNSNNNISDNTHLSIPTELYSEIIFKYIDNPNTVAHVCKLFYGILYSESYSESRLYNHYSKEVNSLLGRTRTVKLIENPEKFPNLLCLKKTILSKAIFLDRKMIDCSGIPSVMKQSPYSYDIFALSERFECYNSFPIFYDEYFYFDKIFDFTLDNNYLKCAEKIICYFKGKSTKSISESHFASFNCAIAKNGTGELKELLPHLLSLDKSMLNECAIVMAFEDATKNKDKDLIQILLPHVPDDDRFIPERTKALECLKSIEDSEKPNQKTD